jgi:hypothetical protein
LSPSRNWECVKVGIDGNYLKAPIPRFGLGTIFGVMPHFVEVETCSFGFHPNISLGLARFERSPLLHKISLRFKPRALEMFGLLLYWAFLPSVSFSFMAQLLVKELVVFFNQDFSPRPTSEKPFMMASDNEEGQFSSSFHLAQVGSPITN